MVLRKPLNQCISSFEDKKHQEVAVVIYSRNIEVTSHNHLEVFHKYVFMFLQNLQENTCVGESLFKESCRPLACNFKKDFIFLWICKIFESTFSMEITRVGTPFGGNYKSETG